MSWEPNEDTLILIHRYMEVMKERLPWLLDVAEFIQGCTVEDLDPYSAGLTTWPRLIQVKLRGEYNTDVWYRQSMGLAVTDEVTVVRIRDGDQYEIFSAGGSSGAGLPGVSFANPTAQVGTSAVNGTATTAMRSDAAPPINQGITPTWTNKHTFDGDLDMNGNDHIWDADADTKEYAAVDDEIAWDIGGVVSGRRYSDGIQVIADQDFFPNMDGRGLASRFINSPGLTLWDAHFRPSETTGPGNGTLTGYAWAGAPLGGTPAAVYYSYNDDYLYMADAAKCFLYTNIANAAASWQGKYIEARVSGGITVECGVRIDDGTDNNWVEMFLDGSLVVGESTLRYRYRDNAGAITTVSAATTVPFGTFLTFQLLCYYSAPNYFAYGYLKGEHGGRCNLVSFSHQLNGNWTAGPPAAGRVGVFVDNAGNSANCDWFYKTFT